ncbi:MAG: acyltransferase family protein [Bacteroides eggerthii]
MHSNKVTPKIRIREVWIDWAKTLLIFMMVVCHAGLYGIPQHIIYAFHMPAFFIISGYLFRPHNWRSLLIRYCIPVLFFSLINLCYNLTFEYLRGSSINITQYLLEYIPPFYRYTPHTPSLFPGIWFIEGLLCCQLLLGIPWIYRNYKVVGCMCVLFSSLQTVFIGNTELQYYYIFRIPAILPFLCLGIYIKKIFNIQYSIFNKIIIIITLIIVIPLSLLNGTIDMISNTFGINYIIFFVNAAITSLLFFHICACFSPKRSIEILSNGTLLILGTHMIYISIWNTITGHININRQFSATFISLIVLICSIYFTKKAANNHSCLLGK